MIKARINMKGKGGGGVFVLGFCDEDLENLKTGAPLAVMMESYRYGPGEGPEVVAMMYAPTIEEVMIRVRDIRMMPDGGIVFHAPAVVAPDELKFAKVVRLNESITDKEGN